MTEYRLSSLKPLTTTARDDARARALRRVMKLAGQRPTRRQFAVEYSALWGILDWLALAVFLSALAISSLNIIAHMGRLANAAYIASPAGIAVPRSAAVVLVQLFSVPMAEFSMLAFVVMFGLARGWRRYVYLVLALLATAFILLSNISSHIGLFESVLPALFTIGTGLRLEYLLAGQLKRRDEIDQRYRVALAEWSTATRAPEQHPMFMPLYAEELWQKLTSYTANRAFIDAPADFKRAAVQRELEALRWAYTNPTHGAPGARRSNAPSGVNNVEDAFSQHENHAGIAVTRANNGHIEPA